MIVEGEGRRGTVKVIAQDYTFCEVKARMRWTVERGDRLEIVNNSLSESTLSHALGPCEMAAILRGHHRI
jgi:hypothetical protein